MGQIEELKSFVSERLHAAASEILGAIEKTITTYEEQTSRLKEENDRHRSLLDIILKAKLPETAAANATKSTPTASSLSPSDSRPTRETKETHCHSSDLKCVFTSRTDLLKLTSSSNCPYCLKKIQATEEHLTKKHFLCAVHFTENGIEKFVIPCTCKDRIQGRSHWHCPYCVKIIFRKCNFEQHLTKQHRDVTLQQSQDAGINQPSVPTFDEAAPLSSEPWCQKEHDQMVQSTETSMLLQIKDKEEEMWRQVSHPELQNSDQLQIISEQMQKDNSQMGEQIVEADHTFNSFVKSYSQDPSKINSVESGKGHPLSNSYTQTLETQPDSGVGAIWQPVGEYQHTTEDQIEEWKKTHTPSNLKAISLKRKKLVKSSLPPLSLHTKKSTQLSVSQNPTGPHCCKACGKSFHYMYTLRTHAQAHTVDKIHICGICGKHSKSRENLVHHLQSHTKRNICGICGKQFSHISRLKRHRRFHRPKGLNVMS